MESKLIEKTLKFWESKLSYAEYDSNGVTHRVKIENTDIDLEQGKLTIDFIINDEIDTDTSITRVAWFDDNGDMLDESTENIIRESYVEGILYRYKLTLRREDV